MSTSLSIPAIINDPQWGDECPVCGDAFTTSQSGIIWPGESLSADCFAWARVCQAPAPDELQAWIDERDPNDEFALLPVAYVHTVSDV